MKPFVTQFITELSVHVLEANVTEGIKNIPKVINISVAKIFTGALRINIVVHITEEVADLVFATFLQTPVCKPLQLVCSGQLPELPGIPPSSHSTTPASK